MKRLLWVCSGLVSVLFGVWLMAGCEGSDSSGANTVLPGGSIVRGNVESMDVAGVHRQSASLSRESCLARVARAVSDLLVPSAEAATNSVPRGTDGIAVTLSGPADRSAVTGDNGVFSITNVPAGEYQVAFEWNGEKIRYRGNSGQQATLTVGTNEVVELLNIRISGSHVNIGNIKVSKR